MATDTIARMTQSEFKEMLETVVEATVERTLLEILGDPDEGLEISSDLRERLLRQRQDVAIGQYGQRFDDVVRDVGLGQVMYQIRILDAAAQDLARLDPAVARRIVNRVHWLAENLEDVRPEALTGDLSAFYKL